MTVGSNLIIFSIMISLEVELFVFSSTCCHSYQSMNFQRTAKEFIYLPHHLTVCALHAQQLFVEWNWLCYQAFMMISAYTGTEGDIDYKT